MEISTYFIWIFMTCSVSLVQTEERPQLKVFIQYRTGVREWRLDKQKINSMCCEEMIQSAVEYLKLNMNNNLVLVYVRITDCKTGNSSRLENIVRDINQCSYNGSSLFPPTDEKRCFKVHFYISKMDESPNWKKECDDWPEEFQESYRKAPEDGADALSRDSSQVFTTVLLVIILLGVLMVIFIYINMRVIGKFSHSIKDPSCFGSFAPLPFYRGSKSPAGDDEEAQNRLILDLISAEPDDDDDDDEGQDRLSVGLNPTEGRCTKSMDDIPPSMDGDDDDEGQNRLVAGLTPASRRSTHSMVNPPTFAGDEEAQNRLISEEGRCTKSMDFPLNMAGDDDDDDDDDDDEGQNRLVAGLTPAAQSWNSRNVSTPNLAFGRNDQ